MNNEYYSMKKRLLAIVMSLMMIFQMIPAGAFAAGEGRITSQPLRADDGTYHIKFDGTYITYYVPRGNMIGISAPDPDPAPEGQQFIGWYCEDAGEWFSIQYQPSSHMHFVPKYGWTVNFRNHIGDVISTRQVPDGEEIGALPDVPPREDYKNGFWGIGTATQTGQSAEWSAGEQVTSDYVVWNDLDIVAGYTRITYTITFYKNTDKTEIEATRTVNADTHYCVNDVPAVPEKTGYTGKWVYNDKETNTIKDYNNQIAVSEDTAVWPAYDQNVFTVTFKTDDDVYQTDTYYKGDKLTLPEDPVIEGKQFEGWYIGETEYVGGEAVTSDIVLDAKFTKMFSVTFIVENEGAEEERLSQYFRTGGEPIGTMPQDPFVAGKAFEKWVIRGTDTKVTAETVVNGNMVVVAQFRTIDIYDLTAEYYYLNDRGQEVIFNTDLHQIEAQEMEDPDHPYTITAPATTQTEEQHVAGSPVYYVSTPTKTITKNLFNSEKNGIVRFEYVSHTAIYDFVYLLKDLTGDGYTEIERKEVEGVLNSFVTPTVNTYDYATLESAEGAEIVTSGMEGQRKQELYVKYNRKNYSLSYDSTGGSYVGGATVPYETNQALSTTVPTRDGYTFNGWYDNVDENGNGTGNQVTGSIVITENTTLYANWTGKTVNYTIIYLKEEYNPSGTNEWVYENSSTAQARVGSIVYAASAPGINSLNNGYERLQSINGTTNAAGTGADTAVEIKADGSATLKVYYSLIRYTLVFKLDRNDGRILKNGQEYSGSNYKIENVVLGQNVGSLWPAGSSEVYTSNNNANFQYWTGAGGNYVTRRYELIWDNVKNAVNGVMTFTAVWTQNNNNRDAYYWLQQPDGTWAIADEYSQTGLNTSNLTPKDIDGYTKHPGSDSNAAGTVAPSSDYPSSGNVPHTEQEWVEPYDDVFTINDTENAYSVGQIGTYNGHTYTVTKKERRSGIHYYQYRYTFECHEEGHYEDVTVNVYTYNFYYDRAKYHIDYYYGTNKLDTKDNIFYEADITGSEYNYTPERPSGIDSDYTWGGWYADSKLSQQYTFNTMPGHHLVLYAKWVAPTFTVDFETDGGTPVPETKTVSKYEKVSKPASNPIKEGYTFEGWFTSDDGNTLYDWNNQITHDTTIYAHWTRDTLTYTVRYVDEEGEAVAPDKTVTNPNFTVGQVITEQALAVAGYRPNVSSQDLTLAATNNLLTFVYSAKVNKTSYTVRYIIDPAEYPGDIPVADPITINDVPGDTASVIELAAGIDYEALYEQHPELTDIEFYPDQVEKTLVLTADPTANVFTFYYSSFKNAKVIVRYVDMEGKPIEGIDTDIQILKVGKSYTLNRVPISDWELNKAVEGENYEGTAAGTDYKITSAITSSGLSFTLFYQKKLTITAVNQIKAYDGSALTLPDNINDQVSVEGLKNGHTLNSISYSYSNTDNTAGNGRLNAGVATVTPKDAVINNASENYYKIRYISGTLEVTKINVTVRVEPDRWTGNIYDGTVKMAGFTNRTKNIEDYVIISHDGYKAEYLDDIWSAVISKATYDAEADGYKYYGIARSDAGRYPYFNNGVLTLADLPQNDNYSVNLYVRPGLLEIKPKPVTITTGSDTKVYDGTPLTKEDEYTVNGIIDGETYGFEITGSQTEVGNSTNDYTITWGSPDNEYTAKADNYSITKNLGILTVNKATLNIRIKDKVTVYNGSEQYGYDSPKTVTGTGSTIETNEFIITGLAEGDMLQINGYEPSFGTDTGSIYTNGSFGEAIIFISRNGINFSSSYEITTIAGGLTINPVEIELTADSATKEYDGTALTKNTYKITKRLRAIR